MRNNTYEIVSTRLHEVTALMPHTHTELTCTTAVLYHLEQSDPEIEGPISTRLDNKRCRMRIKDAAFNDGKKCQTYVAARNN